jgi:hypothetical protein
VPNQTAVPPDESESDGFDVLQGRFLSLTSRLEVLSQALYSGPTRLTVLRPPSSFCENPAARGYRRLARVHEHTPKAVRRHLDESLRAMIAARVATMNRGRPALNADPSVISQGKASNILGVSPAPMSRAE